MYNMYVEKSMVYLDMLPQYQGHSVKSKECDSPEPFEIDLLLAVCLDFGGVGEGFSPDFNCISA